MSQKNVIATQVEQFFGQYPRYIYADGTLLIPAGRVVESAYFLESGHVAMLMTAAEGQQLTFNIFKPGTFFPAMALVEGIPNEFEFQALGEVWVRQAPVEAARDFLKRHPDVLFDLTRRILIGVAGLSEQIQLMMSADARAKLVHLLQMLDKRFGEGEATHRHIKLNLTHAQLAALAGITRETASRQLGALKKQGLIEYGHGGGLVILEPGKLTRN